MIAQPEFSEVRLTCVGREVSRDGAPRSRAGVRRLQVQLRGHDLDGSVRGGDGDAPCREPDGVREHDGVFGRRALDAHVARPHRGRGHGARVDGRVGGRGVGAVRPGDELGAAGEGCERGDDDGGEAVANGQRSTPAVGVAFATGCGSRRIIPPGRSPVVNTGDFSGEIALFSSEVEDIG